jgi:hypothetical protein
MISNDTFTEHRNGRSLTRLGNTSEDHHWYELNGRELMAWKTADGRYFSGIAALLDDARNDYADSRVRVFDGPAPPDMVESVRTLLEACRADGTLPEEQKLLRLVDELRQSLRTYDETPVWKAREVDWSAYITRVLMILIPGLEEHEAELLGTDKRFGILIELGYFKAPTAADADGEGAPPADAVPPESAPSTGGVLEPVSPGSTA